jgi:hypothetical protein
MLLTVLICESTYPADDLAVGRVHEQLDPVAVLVECVELAAGILEFGLLDFVALSLDFGLQLLHREPLGLGGRRARLAEAASLGGGRPERHGGNGKDRYLAHRCLLTAAGRTMRRRCGQLCQKRPDCRLLIQVSDLSGDIWHPCLSENELLSCAYVCAEFVP